MFRVKGWASQTQESVWQKATEIPDDGDEFDTEFLYSNDMDSDTEDEEEDDDDIDIE